jgi:hypothetical protein
MALVLKDRVKETTSVVGTGSATLLGAVTKYQAFSVIGNANTTHYAIIHRSLGEWEVGIGTYTLAGTLLSRDTVLDSSASGAKVSFSAGTKDVICTYPAGKAVFQGGDLGIPLTGNLINCTGVPANSFKNRIINGAMKVDQRNEGASITPTVNIYSVDRWFCSLTQASKFSATQAPNTACPGFINAINVTSLSAYTVLAADLFAIAQRIEGINIADLGFGTAIASPLTLSFWVNSTLTGNLGGVLSGATGTRSFPFTYTINNASTWEYKTVSIPGCIDGTWLTTENTNGLSLYFSFGAGANFSGPANGTWQVGNFVSANGAVSIVGTNGAVVRITGVQLEKGSVATPYDYVDYNTELLRCQRYCQAISNGCRVLSQAVLATVARAIFPHTVPTMKPISAIVVSGTMSNYVMTNSAFNPLTATAIALIVSNSTNTTELNVTCATGLVAGNASLLLIGGTGTKIVANADF